MTEWQTSFISFNFWLLVAFPKCIDYLMFVQLFEKWGLICRNHFLYSMHARYISFKNGTNSSLTFAQTKLRRMCWKFWDWNCTDMTRRREPRAPKLFFGTVAYSCSLGQVDLEPKPWAVENNEFREQTKSGSMGKQICVACRKMRVMYYCYIPQDLT